MVTAAVLGAAVGVGTALVLTLTLLIYRYHVAQKKEAADYHYPNHGSSGHSNSWSTRDSWAPAPTPPTPPTHKTSHTSLSEGTPNSRRRPHAKLYLPLTIHHQVGGSIFFEFRGCFPQQLVFPPLDGESCFFLSWPMSAFDNAVSPWSRKYWWTALYWDHSARSGDITSFDCCFSRSYSRYFPIYFGCCARLFCRCAFRIWRCVITHTRAHVLH